MMLFKNVSKGNNKVALEFTRFFYELLPMDTL